MRIFNLKIVCTTERKLADYVEAIKAYLKDNIPVMVLADVFNLPYDDDKKEHIPRYITCYEWRKSEKKIEIVDTVYDILYNRCYQDAIDEDIIFTNDMSNLLIGDVFSIWRIVHIETGNSTEGRFAAKCIKIPPMVHQECYEVHFGNIISQYKVGYLGIKYLKEELIKYLTCSDKMDKNNNFIKNVFKQLNSYTGPVVTRTLFHQFLKMVGFR